MPAILLVGSISETATATLADGGYTVEGVDEQLLVDPANGGSDLRGAVTERVEEVDCALVSVCDWDLDAIEILSDTVPNLPILYAVDAEAAGAAGAALAAGADDRVLLNGDRDGDRISRRLTGLVESPERSNGSLPTGQRRSATGRDTPGQYDGIHDHRIGALLEGAQDFMAASSADAVAETAVETAERALGYGIVGVFLQDEDGETTRLAAKSARADELLEGVETKPLEESLLRATLENERTVELDAEALAEQTIESLGGAVLFPLGSHGVLGFGSTDEDAFGEGDRRAGELLAANARSALDRIERVERIETIHGVMREMLDARSPDEVADYAVDAARSILGYRFVTCFMHDEETERLQPVAWTAETDALTDGDIPSPSPGDGAMEAFQSGVVVRRDSAGSSGGIDGGADLPFTSRLHVPIESHGTILVATPGDEPFDESDVQVARLLATNTARALDRVERTHELERLETVFDTVNDMVYVHDEDGYLLHCTPVLADRLGYDRDELIGENVGTLIDKEAEAEGVNLIQELIGEPPGATKTQRLDLSTSDGEEVPVELDISLLPGEEYRGVVGSVRDISDLLAVRERLDSQQDRFEYLFENIPDPVVEGYLDDEATVGSVNTAFEETFGYEESEIAGETLNDVIVPEENLDQARELDERSAAGKVNQAEVERETQYGLREFLFRGVPYEAPDGRMHGFGIYTDITEQKERERHLEVLQRLLRHNVRNEVNVLLAGIDQLEAARQDDSGEIDDEQEAELLATLDETAQDLLTMSQKAKRISRVIDAETDRLGELDAAAITRSVVEQFRHLNTDATIEADLPPECPILGSGAIERAIEELLGNALQHGGTAPTIRLTLTCDDDGAELTVADDGPGIPEAERNVLEDGEITPLQHGSGLGLWLVAHATAASGGTVTFDEAADGARVTLSFRRPNDEG
ncbi:PAS domain S-box protein [Salinarchaeum sp. Harcht-Bsk1]|uniref:PAS domain S-box protein n=1 Tax=Salinarchaeum sp. Harcht-Bsk1 TaxID=1333523 RepID=UPI000677A852|nr:PAS domain S-box protein [Salinarchaeum sp. Harcht-Bsk1]